MSDVGMKFCYGCEIEHPITDFAFRNKAQGIRLTQCKAYKNTMDLARRYSYPETKACIGCTADLPLEEYWYKSEETGQLEARCIVCITMDRDPVKKSETRKTWYYEKGGDEWVRNYNQEYKPRRNARNKERLKTDPIYATKQRVRCRIYECLKNSGQTRTNKIKYLGADIDYYNKWLEYQFDENMTRENYGEYWEIDHIFPIDSFDLTVEDQIYECFDWKNTRPLEKK